MQWNFCSLNLMSILRQWSHSSTRCLFDTKLKPLWCVHKLALDWGTVYILMLQNCVGNVCFILCNHLLWDDPRTALPFQKSQNCSMCKPFCSLAHLCLYLHFKSAHTETFAECTYLWWVIRELLRHINYWQIESQRHLNWQYCIIAYQICCQKQNVDTQSCANGRSSSAFNYLVAFVPYTENTQKAPLQLSKLEVSKILTPIFCNKVGNSEINEQGELTASYRWSGWSWRLQEKLTIILEESIEYTSN